MAVIVFALARVGVSHSARNELAIACIGKLDVGWLDC
jgi:hypothetical protein